MSNKYPYIATNGLNNFLVYAENTATLIGDENNCFSSGFKIALCEDGLTDITREYLANTYGKVESKEHAEFISKLAMSAGFGFPFNKVKSNGYFSVSGGNVYFWGSESEATSWNEKLITIPLPPKKETKKEPENKDWPQVGDDALFECSENPKSHEDCNLDEHCIVDTWFNGDELVVVAIVTGFDGSLLPVVQNKRTKEVSAILKKLIKKPKTPEQELRDELINDLSTMQRESNGYTAEMLLSKYNITKKPQKGDLLVMETKKSKGKRIAVMVKDVVNGDEVILQKSTNSYFIWSLYKSGESWVWRVWNLGQVKPTTSLNNTNQLLDY